ncbi:hypothetical protein ACIQU6_15590 [Streptomyces sp. NPDC090442]|uniref:hypothetical protein n=1 Tax=Streptomyces sp. NPDC090442 TaxID=3365962 RepID=UPI0037F23AC5
MIAANPELREREALKELGLIASMVDALKRRGVPDLAARVAAELGALAWKIAYERWRDTTNRYDFAELTRRTLTEVQRPAPCADPQAPGTDPLLLPAAAEPTAKSGRRDAPRRTSRAPSPFRPRTSSLPRSPHQPFSDRLLRLGRM